MTSNSYSKTSSTYLQETRWPSQTPYCCVPVMYKQVAHPQPAFSYRLPRVHDLPINLIGPCRSPVLLILGCCRLRASLLRRLRSSAKTVPMTSYGQNHNKVSDMPLNVMSQVVLRTCVLAIRGPRG